MEPWWPQRVTNTFQRMQTNRGIHESVAAITAEVTVLVERRFHVAKNQNKTHISVAFKEDSHQLFAFFVVTCYPGLPIESQLLHTAEGKFLILHTLVTCCCLTLSKHLRETVSWSRAAAQLKTAYKQRYDSSCNVSTCTHAETRQHEESGGLFFQLRRAESSRIEKKQEREERKIWFGDLYECSLCAVLSVLRHPGESRQRDDRLA